MMIRAWRDVARLPRQLWLLFFSSLINRAGTMALPFLVLYLTRELGFAPAQAALTLGLYGAGALAINPVAGWLVDRWGATRVLWLSLISSGTLLLFYPLARSFAAIAPLTVLWSILNEVFRPASLSATSSFAPPENRKAAFALNRLAVNLGMSLGLAIGGLIARRSFPAIFYIDGATSIAAGALVWLNFPAPKTKAQPQARESLLGSVRSALADPALRRFALAIIPVAVVFFQHESTMSLFMVRDLRLPETDYGLVFTINTLLIVAVEIPLNAATAAWPHRLSMALGAALFGVGFGALALARSFLGVALTVVVWTFGEMLLFPTSSAYVADISPEARRGGYMSLYVMAFSVAFLIGPWLGVRLMEACGAAALWGACLAFGTASAALLWRGTVETA